MLKEEQLREIYSNELNDATLKEEMIQLDDKEAKILDDLDELILQLSRIQSKEVVLTHDELKDFEVKLNHYIFEYGYVWFKAGIRFAHLKSEE